MALVVAARLAATSSSAPVPPPTVACGAPVEVSPPGGPARVVCVDDPALAGCGALVAGDHVELTAGRCVRSPGGMSAPARVAHGLKLDVNRADAQALVLLDGIGPRLAAAIVAERTAHGPFATLDDLRRVRGVGPKVLARLATMLEAGPSSPTREGP